jgi:hypothetical protein
MATKTSAIRKLIMKYEQMKYKYHIAKIRKLIISDSDECWHCSKQLNTNELFIITHAIKGNKIELMDITCGTDEREYIKNIVDMFNELE